MAADVIVAQPATLTGSIGVFSGKFSLGGTLDKLGINLETVSDGLMADMNSPVEPYTEEARRRVQRQIDQIYEEFLVRVAQGREMTLDAAHAVAQGRVWTGRQAQEVGLVDELGGLVQAIANAKEEAGIDPDQPIRLVAYPRPRTFLEILSTSFAAWSASVGPSWLNVSAPRFPAALVLPLQHFRQGEPLALMPFTYLN
jgi:protease-4